MSRNRDRRNRGNKGFRPRRMQRPKIEISREPVVTKTTPFGLFIFHEDKQIKKELWGKDPAKCAQRYIDKDSEIKKLNNTIPLKARRVSEGVFGEELKMFALKNGFDADEFDDFFQKFSVELTKLKLKFGFQEDKLAVQAVQNLIEVNKMTNILYERLSEWYGFYFPESVKKAGKMEDFAEIVGKKRKEESMGYNLADKDLEIIGVSGNELKNLLALRESLEEYIEKKMEEIAPNLGKVAGPVLGAKLIAEAGSLKKLSGFPASTVQLLGAEKALFRHLRKGTSPPKHGVILQHNMMARVKFENRGKFARFLSGKISIAAKVDYYSKGKERVWENMVKDIEKKANSLS